MFIVIWLILMIAIVSCSAHNTMKRRLTSECSEAVTEWYTIVTPLLQRPIELGDEWKIGNRQVQ